MRKFVDSQYYRRFYFYSVSSILFLWSASCFGQESRQEVPEAEHRLPVVVSDSEIQVPPEQNSDRVTGGMDSVTVKTDEKASSRDVAFVEGCQKIQALSDSQDLSWLSSCDVVYSYCVPQKDGEGEEQSPSSEWSETHYGSLVCRELLYRCKQGGFVASDVNSEEGTEDSWANTLEKYASTICDLWPHCVNQTVEGDEIQKLLVVAVADSLSAMGFDVRIRDGHVQLRRGYAQFMRQKYEDKVLNKILDIYGHLIHQKDIATDDTLSREMDALFSQDATDLSETERLSVFSTILPDIIQHAQLSGTSIKARKLRESMQSVRTHIPDNKYQIQCVREVGNESVEMIFPARALISDDYESMTVRHSLQCPRPEDLYLDRGTGIKDEMICRSIPENRGSESPVEFFNQALADAHYALQNRDNDGIAESMGRLTDGLIWLYERYGYIARWNDHWGNAPLQTWMCQIQTIELLALDLQRMIELARLERALQTVFGKTTFYQRLSEYSQCSSVLKGDFLVSSRQMTSAHQSDYTWIVRHFSEKGRKNLDSAISSWTHRVSSSVALSRRLLASWTAWSFKQYKDAVKYAYDVTDNRSIIIHPQLNSYHQLLSVVQNGSFEREKLEYYTRVMLLKVPALVYQMLTESRSWLSSSGRAEVVDVVRQYSPGLSPHEAARFYETYAKEFRKNLDARKRADLDRWMETERSRYERESERLKRRLVWLEELAEIEDWRGISMMASYILANDGALTREVRMRFLDIEQYALKMQDSEVSSGDEVIYWRGSSDETYKSCVGKAVEGRAGRDEAHAFLGSVPKCWTK